MPGTCEKRPARLSRDNRKKASASPARSFVDNEKGDAVVEAVIIFPIMIMIFAALVLLAIYLPTRAALQRATQYAATAIATEMSDTWLFFNDQTMSYYWETNKDLLTNVYVALFSGAGDVQGKGDGIVTHIEGRGISSKAGVLEVVCYPVNRIVYKEIVITATRDFTVPVNLSLIGFPQSIPVTVTSTAVVVNGDEFVRNMDLAYDFVGFILEKFNLTNITDTIGSSMDRVSSFFGW